MFTLQIVNEQWTPGQTRTMSETWDQRNNDGQAVQAGSYSVTGSYSVSPALVSPPRSFSIGGGTAPPSGYTMTVSTDKAQYAAGDTVRFTLQVTYNGSSPVIVERPSFEADFVVRNANGQEIWRWTHGKAFTANIVNEQWAPGQSRSFSQTWDQRNNDGQAVGAGTYSVVGFYSPFPSDGTQPQSFAIGGGSGATGRWIDRPPTSAGATQSCPTSGQWTLFYWDGPTTAIANAAAACANTDRFWVNRSGQWLAFAPEQPQASDAWDVVSGEATFGHGSEAAAGVPAAPGQVRLSGGGVNYLDGGDPPPGNPEQGRIAAHWQDSSMDEDGYRIHVKDCRSEITTVADVEANVTDFGPFNILPYCRPASVGVSAFKDGQESAITWGTL
jgi:hypothetical protein